MGDLVAVPYSGEQGVLLVGDGPRSTMLPSGRRAARTIACSVELPVVKRRPFAVISAIEYEAQPFVGILQANGIDGLYSETGATIPYPREVRLESAPGNQNRTLWIYPGDTPGGVYALIP